MAINPFIDVLYYSRMWLWSWAEEMLMLQRNIPDTWNRTFVMFYQKTNKKHAGLAISSGPDAAKYIFRPNSKHGNGSIEVNGTAHMLQVRRVLRDLPESGLVFVNAVEKCNIYQCTKSC